MGHIPHSEVHEITPAEFAVDSEVEQREIPNPASELQPNADRPDFLELERRFRPDQSALVPGPRMANRLVCVFYVESPDM